jgi:hypothetical protein
MSTHKDHRFSITVHTVDLAVLYCLRALADYSQKTGNTRITWGGTTKADWKRNEDSVTFRFTRPEYRVSFTKEANRVLQKNSWIMVSESDSDPAVKRS